MRTVSYEQGLKDGRVQGLQRARSELIELQRKHPSPELKELERKLSEIIARSQ